MNTPIQRRFWPVCRKTFRWCRIWIFFAFLTLLCVVLYLNQHGLPGFMHAAVTRELEARGIQLDYENLRLGMAGSVIADRVSARMDQDSNAPRVGLDRVELKLDPSALARGKFKIAGLGIRKGRVEWPISKPGEPLRVFALSNVVASLRFLPGDRWEIDRLDASVLGLKVQLNASITNATAISSRARTPRGASSPDRSRDWMEKIQSIAEQARLHRPPEILVLIEGDAARPESFSGRLTLTSGAGSYADSAWKDLLITAHWNLRLSPEAEPSSQAEIRVGSIQSRFGQAQSIHLSTVLNGALSTNLPRRLDWKLEAWAASGGDFSLSDLHVSGHSSVMERSPWKIETQASASAGRIAHSGTTLDEARLTVTAGHGLSPTNLLAGTAKVVMERAYGSWGKVSKGNVALTVRGFPTRPSAADPALGLWAMLTPWTFDLELGCQDLDTPKLAMEQTSGRLDWDGSRLRVSELGARLYGGEAHVSAEISPGDRKLKAAADSTFDLHRISPWLTENSQRWLKQFTWTTPPKINGDMSVILPAWTNRQPEWKAEVLPTLSLRAEVTGSAGAFRGIEVKDCFAQVGLSNVQWIIPVIRVHRPEGSATLAYFGHMLTQDYHWIVDSRLDPTVAAPLLEPEHQKALTLFQLGKPPVIRGDVWGRWFDRSRMGVDLRIEATNVALRGVAFNSAATRLQWTNSAVRFLEPRVERVEGESAEASSVIYETTDRVVLVEGAKGRLDAMVVAPALGKGVVEALAPYRFAKPPNVVARGRFAVGDMDRTEIVFDVEGEDFYWWRFHTPKIGGRLTWKGRDVILTGVKATFAQGTLGGDALFKVAPTNGAQFNVQAEFANLALNSVVADLALFTNKLAGQLTGTMQVTSGQTSDQATWTGHGQVELRDGFLWDIPLFGFFSPILNGLVPGMGRAAMSSGKASFRFNNRLVHTDDLEIRSSPMNIQYRGDVDFDGKVNATAMAEILKETWGVGKVFSVALLPLTKLLEYKVSGTLTKPKSEPLYIPRFLTFPLTPFRTLRSILPDDKEKPAKGPKTPTPE